MIIPIVNMVTISLPRETTAVGLGINTMLRNLGGAIGPVVATAIMTTYTTPLVVQGHTVAELPSATAFDIVFEVALVLAAGVIVLAYTSRNYTFRRNGKGSPSPMAS